MPTVLWGDFNAEPFASELEPLEALLRYAHVDRDVSFITHGKVCIDYFMVKDIEVAHVGVDVKVSDHWAVVAKLVLAPPGPYPTIKRFAAINIQPEVWSDNWKLGWPAAESS